MRYLAAILLVVSAHGERPVVLENGHVRLELEPRTFSVRFAGFPGGKNFLDPVYLTESELVGSTWIDPGGATTDLLPARENSALLHRGPAEVVVLEERYVLLLGPEHPERNWRVKKEYFLADGAPEVRYKVTVTSSRKEERRVGVRITAQVPRAGRLEVPSNHGALGLMRGTYPAFEMLLEGSGGPYSIPVRGAEASRRAVLTAPVPSVTLQTPFGAWSRRLELTSGVAGDETGTGPRIVLLLDDVAHVYQAGLEVMQSGVNVGAPLVATEYWQFSQQEMRIASEE